MKIKKEQASKRDEVSVPKQIAPTSLVESKLQQGINKQVPAKQDGSNDEHWTNFWLERMGRGKRVVTEDQMMIVESNSPSSMYICTCENILYVSVYFCLKL